MPFDIKGIGEGAVNAAVGQGMGLLFGKIQDKRQLNQQDKLNANQLKHNKQAAEHQYGLNLEMANATAAPWQVKKLDEAGLNPALMYGGSGAGGATSAAGGNTAGVSGGSAGDPNAGVGMGMQMAAQIGLMKAQKENIEADTENKKAGAGSADATTENTKADTAGKNIKNSIAAETKEDVIKTARATAEQEMQKIAQEQAKGTIARETANTQIMQVKQDLIGTILEQTLTKAKTRLTNRQTQAIGEAIEQEWRNLALKGREMTFKELNAGVVNQLQERGIRLGEDALAQKTVNDAINSILGGAGLGINTMGSSENTQWENYDKEGNTSGGYKSTYKRRN